MTKEYSENEEHLEEGLQPKDVEWPYDSGWTEDENPLDRPETLSLILGLYDRAEKASDQAFMQKVIALTKSRYKLHQELRQLHYMKANARHLWIKLLADREYLEQVQGYLDSFSQDLEKAKDLMAKDGPESQLDPAFLEVQNRKFSSMKSISQDIERSCQISVTQSRKARNNYEKSFENYNKNVKVVNEILKDIINHEIVIPLQKSVTSHFEKLSLQNEKSKNSLSISENVVFDATDNERFESLEKNRLTLLEGLMNGFPKATPTDDKKEDK